MKGGWMAQTDQTYQDQYNWFKLVYGYAQQSLSSDYGYKGIMFWRWASVDPTAGTEGFDGAATISEWSSQNSAKLHACHRRCALEMPAPLT